MATPITAQMLLDWAEQYALEHPTYIEYTSLGEAARPNSAKRELVELTLRLDAFSYRDEAVVELVDVILGMLRDGYRGYNDYSALELAQALVEDYCLEELVSDGLEEFLADFGPDAA